MTVNHNGTAHSVKTLSEAVTIVTSGDTKKVFAVDANADGSGYITLKDGSSFKVY